VFGAVGVGGDDVPGVMDAFEEWSVLAVVVTVAPVWCMWATAASFSARVWGTVFPAQRRSTTMGSTSVGAAVLGSVVGSSMVSASHQIGANHPFDVAQSRVRSARGRLPGVLFSRSYTAATLVAVSTWTQFSPAIHRRVWYCEAPSAAARSLVFHPITHNARRRLAVPCGGMRSP
jgi:hypothetical protein